MDKYLQEFGANEEFLPIILESFLDWDENMQLECAKSFKRPIEINAELTEKKLIS